MLNASTQSKREVPRQACDPCRTRKAKCEQANDNGKQPCRRCLRLSLECTYHLPFGVRGPRRKILSPTFGFSASPASDPAPNLEATGNDVTSPGSQLYLVQSEPSRLPSEAQRWPISPNAVSKDRSPATSYTHSLSDELCTRDLLKQILLDYLRYLYPLVCLMSRSIEMATFSSNR